MLKKTLVKSNFTFVQYSLCVCKVKISRVKVKENVTLQIKIIVC